MTIFSLLVPSACFNQLKCCCQVAALQATDYSLGGALDSAWMCLCGALVMFMHAGFGMLETGCCRAKNASNVLMKNLVNVCVGTLGWWLFGWAFAYGTVAVADGGNGFIGTHGVLEKMWQDCGQHKLPFGSRRIPSGLVFWGNPSLPFDRAASGFAGFDFYTQDKTTGVITPASCSADGCQSTMCLVVFGCLQCFGVSGPCSIICHCEGYLRQ